MGLFDRTNYQQVGRSGNGYAFAEAFRKVSGRKQKNLVNGAVEAFRDDRQPENLQILLSKLEFHGWAYDLLQQITKDCDNKADIIQLALKEANEDQRKKILDRVLFDAIYRKSPDESFVAALLNSGADANYTELDGSTGSLLAISVRYKHPPAISQLLIDNDASITDALRWAHREQYGNSYIAVLESYEKEAAKAQAQAVQPQAVNGTDTQAAIFEELQALRETMEQLPARMAEAVRDALQSPAEGTPAPAPRSYADIPKI